MRKVFAMVSIAILLTFASSAEASCKLGGRLHLRGRLQDRPHVIQRIVHRERTVVRGGCASENIPPPQAPPIKK